MVSRSQAHLVREGRAPSNGEGITVTARPGITGTTTQGQTLTRVAPVSVGFTPTVAYQWFRDRAAIGGATGNTYLLAADDVGKRITLRATLTNAKSPPVVTYSNPTAVVIAS